MKWPRQNRESVETRTAKLNAPLLRRFIGGVATMRSGAAASAVLPEPLPVAKRERVRDPETVAFLAEVHARLRGETIPVQVTEVQDVAE